MFFAGFIVVGAALVTEIVYQPPFWVHAALWLPLILIVTLGPLRPMKGLMIALQYHHKAAESRFGGGRALSAPIGQTRRSWLGLLIPALLAFAVARRTRHLADRAQGLEGSVDRGADRAARGAARRRCRRRPLGRGSIEASEEYRRVTFTATFDHGAGSAGLRRRLGVPPGCVRPRLLGVHAGAACRRRAGAWSIAASCRRAARIRHRARKDRSPGPVEIVGALRWPEHRSWFTPADDPRKISGSRAIRRRSPPARGSARSRRSMSSRKRRSRPAACRSPASSW